jgi:hypothetical protein
MGGERQVAFWDPVAGDAMLGEGVKAVIVQ